MLRRRPVISEITSIHIAITMMVTASLRSFLHVTVTSRPLNSSRSRRKYSHWILAAFLCSPSSSCRPEELRLHPSFLHGGDFRVQTRHRTTIPKMTILDSPSAERNKDPIWKILSERVFPFVMVSDHSDPTITILEVAAGAGVHTEYLASQEDWNGAKIQWIPSDPEELSRVSIAERTRISNLQDIIEPPLPLTLDRDGILQADTDETIRPNSLDLILCINMIHISPWEATLGLMKMAQAKLRKGGMLYCYGPYKVGGEAVESNLSFDRSLRQRDPSWGVRDLEDVIDAAKRNGLSLVEEVEMPANNLSVIYQKKD